MQQSLRRTPLIVIIFGLLFLFPLSVAVADSLDSFEAQIQLPENQKNKEISYFDLTLKPKEKQTVFITLKNTSKQTIELSVGFHRAITNHSGVIEYSGINKDTTKSMPYNIEELVNVNKESITLSPDEEKELPVEIKMPEKSFDGVLAGGIYFEEISTEKVDGNIKNIFSREIALLLHNHSEVIQPEVLISDARATQENYRNIVAVTMENTKPTYIKDVQVDYQLLLDGKEVTKGRQEQMSMAPNSGFIYHIPLEGETFKAGNYEVVFNVKSKEKKWSARPTFTVEAKKAESLNKQDVTVESKSIPWYIIALVGLLIVQAVVVFLLVRRNKRLKS